MKHSYLEVYLWGFIAGMLFEILVILIGIATGLFR